VPGEPGAMEDGQSFDGNMERKKSAPLSPYRALMRRFKYLKMSNAVNNAKQKWMNLAEFTETTGITKDNVHTYYHHNKDCSQ